MNAMSLCFSWQQNIETLNSKLKKKNKHTKKNNFLQKWNQDNEKSLNMHKNVDWCQVQVIIQTTIKTSITEWLSVHLI